MTVAEANALLTSRPSSRQLDGCCEPCALPGWRWSFEALLRSQDAHAAAAGNAGLMPAAAAHTAAPGFRPLRVSQMDRECIDVISLSLQPTDRRRHDSTAGSIRRAPPSTTPNGSRSSAAITLGRFPKEQYA